MALTPGNHFKKTYFRFLLDMKLGVVGLLASEREVVVEGINIGF